MAIAADTLDAVGGEIMRQHGAVHRQIEMRHAVRSRAHQRAVVAQQLFKRRDVAVDHRLDRGFESRHRRARCRHGPDVLGQALPVGEVVPASERQRCIVARDRHRADFLVREVTLEPWNSGIEELWMSSPEQGDRLLVAGLPAEEEHVGLLDIIRERRVVLQVRTLCRMGWSDRSLGVILPSSSEQAWRFRFVQGVAQAVRIVAAKEDNSWEVDVPLLTSLRSRNEWMFFAALPRADGTLAYVWWAVVLCTEYCRRCSRLPWVHSSTRCSAGNC